jgi:PAS domain S-box-containing protein
MGFAEFLSQSSGAILTDWEHANQRIRSAKGLNRPALFDHLPALLQQVVRCASAVAGGKPVPPSESPAEAHAVSRLGESFDLRDVAVELGLLREVVLDHLAESGVPIRVQELKQLNQVIDQALLNAISQYAEVRERTLSTLDRVSQAAIGHSHIDELLPELLNMLRAATPSVDFIAVLLREGDVLRGCAEVGLGHAAWRDYVRPLNEGFSGRIAREKQPLELRDDDALTLMEQAALERLHARAIYGVPLLHEEQVIGVVKIGSVSAASFSTEDKLLFRTLASRLTMLIVQARLLDKHRQSEELLGAILDGATAVVHVKDAQGRYLNVNRKFEAVFQRDRRDTIGRTAYDFYPKEIAASLLENDRRVLLTGQPMEFEERILQSGSIHTYLSLKYPLHDAHGVAYAIAGISTDITDRKRAEEERAELLAKAQAARAEAEESRAILDTFLNCATVGFAFFDRELRYVRMNPALDAIHGAPADAYLGRTTREVNPRMADRIEPLLRRVLETGLPVTGNGTRAEVPPGSGRFTHLLGNFYPVRGPDGVLLGVGAAIMDVTERTELLDQVQAARTAAERSLALVDSLFASSPIGFAFLDRELRFIRINETLADLSGGSVEGHLGRTFREVNPEAAPIVEETLSRVLETGQPILGMELSRAASSAPDQPRDWMLNAYPVRTADGRIIGVGGTVVEITEHKRAEVERERTLELLQTVLDQMPEGVLIAEAPSGRAILGNRQYQTLTGIRPPDSEFSMIADYARGGLIHADGTSYAAEKYPIVRTILHGEVIKSEHVRFRRRNGDVRDFSVNATPVRDSQGRMLAGVVVLSDITEQREAEARATFLVQATEALASSLDYRTTLTKVAELSVPRIADWCSIHVWEEGRTIRAVATAHHDPAKAQLVRELLDRYPINPDAAGPIIQVLRTGKPLLIENVSDADIVATARSEEHLHLLRTAGLKSVLVLPLVARDEVLGAIAFTMAESGRRFSPQSRDLAEELVRRAALAIDNARLYKDAQEAIQARDDFLSMASHDLRSPLAGLLLRSHFLLDVAQKSPGDLRRETTLPSVLAIDRQVTRIATMLDALLDVSRIHAGRLTLELEEVDLATVAREVVGRLDELLQKSGCTWRLDAAAPVIGRWDRLRIEQVVMNLVSNAAKYGAGHPVEISVGAANGRASLRVTDHGVGISPEHQTKLFQRFERVGDKNAFQGTGLGLWIVRNIVEAMDGRIRVESEVGQGATFIVTLPEQGKS